MIDTVHALVGLAWLDFRRDPLGLAFTFVIPIAVAAIMGTIYVSEDAGSRVAPVGIVVETDNPVAAALRDRLADTDVVTLRGYADRSSLERAVRLREVAAGVVVPADVGADSATTPHVELLGPPGIEAPNGIRAAVEAAVTETAAALQLGRALAPGASSDAALRTGTAALTPGQPSPETSPARHDDAVAAALIAALVLFVFMNTMARSALLAQYRELGILARARTTPASPTSIAVGLAVGLMSYAFVLSLLILATAWLVFGVVWDSWPALLVAALVVAFTAGSLGVLTGTLIPSFDVRDSIVGPVGFLLAALGGALWPLEIVGPTLRALGHLTPHAWAVEALSIVGIDGRGITGAGLQLAVLLAGGGLLLLVGSRRARRLAEQAL